MNSRDMAPYPMPALVKNRLVDFDDRCGTPHSRRIVSSRNDVPYHYVVHSDFFADDAYARHVGQHDKLTFFAADRSPSVAVHLYDCRHGSPEYDRKFVIDVTDRRQPVPVDPSRRCAPA